MQNQFTEKDVGSCQFSVFSSLKTPALCPMGQFRLRSFPFVFHDFIFSPPWLFLLRCHCRLLFLQSLNSIITMVEFLTINTSSPRLPFLDDELQNLQTRSFPQLETHYPKVHYPNVCWIFHGHIQLEVPKLNLCTSAQTRSFSCVSCATHLTARQKLGSSLMISFLLIFYIQ